VNWIVSVDKGEISKYILYLTNTSETALWRTNIYINWAVI